MNARDQLRQELAELYEMERKAKPRVTAEQLCAGHAKQLAAVVDKERYIILLCSRRAGKTNGIAIRFLLRSLARKSNCVYIALTKPQARNVTMWDPIWKPMLKRLGLTKESGAVHHDEAEMITTFSNGSVVRFTGASDVRVIETELGSALDEAVIDECQSSPLSVLSPLVGRILPHSLGDHRGTLLLAGTIPEVDGGLFMDKWKYSNWSKHNWCKMDNPHLVDPMGELQEYLAKNPGITINSPEIQRDTFGLFAWDKNKTAYSYDQALNGYHPELLSWTDDLARDGIRLPMTEDEPDGRIWKPSGTIMAAKPEPWVELISFALDPAADSDRVSIQGIGWGKKSRKIQHLFDWTSDPAMKHSTSEMFAVLGKAREHYGHGTGRGILPLKQDAGSSKNAVDNLMRDFKIPIVLAARKGDVKDGVDRVNTLFVSGQLQIMIGSAWEEDCQKARRDPRSAANGGAWKWAGVWHPDASEAGRYSLEHYFDGYEPPAPPVPEEQRGFPTADDEEKPWFNKDMDELFPDGTSELY